MNKIREIIRLSEECKLSVRQIAQALNVSRPVVTQYLSDYKASGLSYEESGRMGDEELLTALGRKRQNKNSRYRVLAGKFEYFSQEMKRVGVTMELLWKKYRAEQPDGYSYGQFCYHFQVWRDALDVTMHMNHKAGEKMFVDYTGKKMRIYDSKNSEVFREVEIFVAILGASQLTYVEASESQKKEDWIKSNENALRYFGGVCGAIVPDCLKSGVTKADWYEPDINPQFNDFARHYGTVILPARPGSPQDKALAENAVKIAYTRIFAPLRDMKFYSIEDLNEAIWKHLDLHNDTHFQRMSISRRGLFNEIEKDMLKPLPAEKYEWKEFLQLTVQFNYHIEFSPDKHFYSVPWQYRRKKVTVIYTSRNVDIYFNGTRIAFHQRDRKTNGYTTVKEHMPPQHQFVSEWSPERMIRWGEEIGENVKIMITGVLERRAFPEQAYKACLGILNLAKKYGNERVNNACKRAVEFNYYSCKGVKNILEKGLDKVQEEKEIRALPLHDNIRGSNYFN
jgi:transposase